MITLQANAEAAARYDDEDPAAALDAAGDRAHLRGGRLSILARNGKVLPVHPGDWVVRYGPGDVGVMSDGAYRRYSGA